MPLIKNGRLIGRALSCACSTMRRSPTAFPSSCRRRASSPTPTRSCAATRRPAWNGRTTARSPSSSLISDRLAVIVLTFPNFKDGRAYSQARLLRERYGFRRRVARRGPDPARPVPVSGARRLRCARGREAERCGSLRRDARALHGVLPGGGRRSRAGHAPAACAHCDAGAARNGALSLRADARIVLTNTDPFCAAAERENG